MYQFYYRVTLVVADLGWVDLNFEILLSAKILLGQLGVWQNWQGSKARWWKIEIKINPT